VPCLVIYPHERYRSSLLFESHRPDKRTVPVFRHRGSVMMAGLYELGLSEEVRDDKMVLYEC
jgi:hypothetical protein